MLRLNVRLNVTKKLLLPAIERVWQYIIDKPRNFLPNYVRDSLVEASLAACTSPTTSLAQDALDVLQGPELPIYLQIAIANQKSSSLRLRGDHNQSDVVINELLEVLHLDSIDIRLHCSYGRLLLSQTENAILRKEFSKAESYLTSWEVKSSPPSLLELQVVRLKNTVVGRVLRYQGQFEGARFSLEKCLEMILSAAGRHHVQHHLADVYCELRLPREAEGLVLDDVDKLRACGRQHSKAFRRLALPLAEAYIEQRRTEAANIILQELTPVYNMITHHDVPDQLGHVRSVIGLARVAWHEARLSDAHQSLENALHLMKNYTTFSERNFYIGVVYLFLSVVHFKLASSILSEQASRHFMPGIGTYFLTHLWQCVRDFK